MEEAPNHPHNQARGTFVEVEGIIQPALAPRSSRTKAMIQGPPPEVGQYTDEMLAAWGFLMDEIMKLRSKGMVA
jgi:alpha-methylacyl-CoA racemase